MIRNIALLSILFLLFIPLVSSESDLGFFKANQDANLVIKCEQNGYLCSGAVCNISVQNPLGVDIVSLDGATNNLNNINYTLNSSQNSEVGLYQGQLTCQSGSLNDTESFTFETTYTGQKDPPGLIFLLFVGGFIVIMFFMFLTLVNSLVRININSLNDLKFDLVDLGQSFAIYFLLWGFLAMHIIYLNHPLINSIVDVALTVGRFTHIIIPGVLFLITMLTGNLRRVIPDG